MHDARMNQQDKDKPSETLGGRITCLALAIFATGLFAVGCGSHIGPTGGSMWKKTIEGSGTVAEEARPAEPIESIELRISCNVVGEVSDSASLTITGDDNLLQYIRTQVIDGKLRIDSEERLKPSSVIKVNITSPELKGASISGSGKIMLNGIETPHFHASISGSGSIQAAGTSENVDATISGSGNIDLLSLPSVNASASISGSGLIQVDAKQSLNAHISGSGSIRYAGDPTVSKHISGSGSVSKTR